MLAVLSVIDRTRGVAMREAIFTMDNGYPSDVLESVHRSDGSRSGGLTTTLAKRDSIFSLRHSRVTRSYPKLSATSACDDTLRCDDAKTHLQADLSSPALRTLRMFQLRPFF